MPDPDSVLRLAIVQSQHFLLGLENFRAHSRGLCGLSVSLVVYVIAFPVQPALLCQRRMMQTAWCFRVH